MKLFPPFVVTSYLTSYCKILSSGKVTVLQPSETAGLAQVDWVIAVGLKLDFYIVKTGHRLSADVKAGST